MAPKFKYDDVGPRVLRRGDALLLPDARYGVSLSWDCVGRGVDLDLQALVVNHKGEVVDAVYHNNPIVLRAAVMHSGDEMIEAQGNDEAIWVDLTRLPETVQLVIFVVGAYAGNMSDAVNGIIHITRDVRDNEVATFELARTKANVCVVATLERRAADTRQSSPAANCWKLSKAESFAKEGRHFMDILEPTVGDLIRRVITDAPKKQSCFFPMEKGSVLHLPQCKWVFFSLMWDLLAQSVEFTKSTFRLSATFFDQQGKVLGAVDDIVLESKGVRHSGPGLTGTGVAVNLPAIPSEVTQIFLVSTCRQPGNPLKLVRNPSCRVADHMGSEIVSHPIVLDPKRPGLIVARLIRETGVENWAFQLLGQSVAGSDWQQCIGDMLRLFDKSPRLMRALGPGPQDPGGPRPCLPEVPLDDDPRAPDPAGAKRNWRDVIDFREHGYVGPPPDF
eukprot:TRINITY_DN12373_c0_g1_i1.p1 TRINITY_DN12373_c0_g1~~TRINITY_DN12373_c0_g1_i1.p1  ORF type:complete len:447 (-),score=54.28 TRINITY_DN12373_c0_g1_i1:186-1526(-)